VSTPLLGNILNQAEALRTISRYQFGNGAEALQQAAHLLQSRKRIVLTGMGASFFACIPFQHMLARQGFDATCVEAAELLYFPPSSVGADTAVVVVSRSGESIEVIRLLTLLKNLGAPVLSVVNVPESTLCKQSNHSIVICSPADQLVAIQTYTATLAVFALLAAAISGELSRAVAELETTIEILGKRIPEWVEERGHLHSFLQNGAPLYLLGRGPAMGAVLEGALLMHEVAKAPAVAMSVPQFRHGPVEVVDAECRAIVIGTQSETASLDSIFANDLRELGAQIRWLGPSGKGFVVQPLCSWPSDLPGRFVSMAETIPLQITAYLQAELRGIRPGDFRWAPAITNSETGFLSKQE
jgi:glucosamine--fructose-6-phosphate aminotransferase (isomerizing)